MVPGRRASVQPFRHAVRSAVRPAVVRPDRADRADRADHPAAAGSPADQAAVAEGSQVAVAVPAHRAVRPARVRARPDAVGEHRAAVPAAVPAADTKVRPVAVAPAVRNSDAARSVVVTAPNSSPRRSG